MPWDDTYKKMYGAVSNADISYPTSQPGPPYAMGSMVYTGSGYLNVAAKYKPVEYPSPGVLTDAQRRSVRYGFGSASTGLPALPLGNNAQNPKNNWQYIPPSTYWRNLDFVKEVGSSIGYNGRAIMPLKVNIGQLVTSAESIVVVMCNAAVNSVPGISPRAWSANDCVSLDDLLVNDYNYFLQFLFVDTTNGVRNLVVCNKQLSSAITASAGGFVYQSFYYLGTTPYYTEVSGIKYPDVPVLANTGHTIRVIVGIGGGPSLPDSSYAYQVITDPATINSWVMYSLGLEDNCDRDTAVVQSGAFVMDGTTITAISVTPTDTYIEETVAGQAWHAYALEINATFDTTGAAAYSGTMMTILGSMAFNTSGKFGPTAATAGSISPGVSAELASKTSGQVKYMFGSGTDNYFWIPVVSGSVIRTSLGVTLDFDTPFTNHCTGSTTVYIPA